MHSKTVSVIIPTYREAQNIAPLCRNIASVMNEANLSYEIIIMDDNSRDGTAEAVAALQPALPLRLIVRTHARGLASAVVEGFARTIGSVCVVMDADLSHPPEKIPELVRAITHGGADFALGSRFMKGGAAPHFNGYRTVNAWVAKMLARPLAHVSDPMSGFFAVPRRLLQGGGALHPCGFKIGLEILVKKRPRKIAEIPITFAERLHGESKLSFKTQAAYLTHLARLFAYACKPAYLLAATLGVALLLRLPGMGYGLPLQVIADEPQFIHTALDMAQQKTLFIPHNKETQALLYNPPFIVYLLLAPFYIATALVGAAHRVDAVFMVGRGISIAAGLASIVFLFFAAWNLFPEHRKKGAFLAAYFTTTSMLAVAVSMSVRHWSFALLLVSAACAVLAAHSMSAPRRYLAASALAGIAVGVNQATAVFIILIALLWYVVVEKNSIKKILSERWFYGGIALCAFFTLLSFFLYPNSLRGVAQESLGGGFTQSFWNIFLAPMQFLGSLAASEPILIIFACIGLYALWREKRRLCIMFFASITTYIALFYFFYNFQHRFLAVLIPLFVLLATSGALFLWRRMPRPWGAISVGILLLVPLIAATRFSYLVARNDSRVQARVWFEDRIPAEARVLTYGYLMRLSAAPGSVTERKMLTNEVSSEEHDEYQFPNLPWGRRVFNALNLYTIKNESLFANLTNYACAHNDEYIMAQTDRLASSSPEGTAIAALLKDSEALASFGSADDRYSLTDTRFEAPFWTLFTRHTFGPPIGIFRINRALLCRNTTTLPLPEPMRVIVNEEKLLTPGNFNLYKFSTARNALLHINVRASDPVSAFLMEEANYKSSPPIKVSAQSSRLQTRQSL